MAIPVPVPIAALPTTNTDNSRAEAFVSIITGLIKNGTTGFTIGGKPMAAPLTVPDGNDPTAVIPMDLSTEKDQSFYRILGLAMYRSLFPTNSLTVTVSAGASNPTSTTNTDTDLMTITLATNGWPLLVQFSGTFEVQSGDDFEVALFLDGNEIAQTRRGVASSTAISRTNVSSAGMVTPSAGTHTIAVKWKVNSGTARGVLDYRTLMLMERP